MESGGVGGGGSSAGAITLATKSGVFQRSRQSSVSKRAWSAQKLGLQQACKDLLDLANHWMSETQLAEKIFLRKRRASIRGIQPWRPTNPLLQRYDSNASADTINSTDSGYLNFKNSLEQKDNIKNGEKKDENNSEGNKINENNDSRKTNDNKDGGDEKDTDDEDDDDDDDDEDDDEDEIRNNEYRHSKVDEVDDEVVQAETILNKMMRVELMDKCKALLISTQRVVESIQIGE